LYLTSRMLFSLSRGGYAPQWLCRLNARGSPLIALLVSSIGMAVALVLDLRFQDTAFVYTLGAAFFGGLFVWMLIFVTHLFFRRHFARPGAPALPARFAPRSAWTSVACFLALAGVMISTWWIPGMKITLLAGPPWLAFITVCYFVSASRRGADAGEAAREDDSHG